jgi:diketogulonate reductase-like aldo/keto reductase
VAAASLLVPGGAAPALAAEAAVEKVVTLNDGAKFPVVSFGLQVYDDTQAYKYTKVRVSLGVASRCSLMTAPLPSSSPPPNDSASPVVVAAPSPPQWALEAGYRNFFASVLAGNQRGFARAIQESSVPRSDLFICGSVLSNRARGFEAARQLSERGCKENMEAFATGGIGYIDQATSPRATERTRDRTNARPNERETARTRGA